MTDDATVDQFAAVARELRAQATEGATLDQAVAIAVDVIDGCQYAGVSLVDDKRHVETVASSDPVVVRGDALQYELDEGPCLDSLRDHETVTSPDLGTERRWSRWAAQVVQELGIRSMLCLQLFTSERSYGALNLYSRSVEGFDDRDRSTALALAAHVAVALAASREIDNRNLAIGRRTTIGQAQGILMERYGLGGEQAFTVLHQVSTQSNRKVFDVAEELVRTRRTPRAK